MVEMNRFCPVAISFLLLAGVVAGGDLPVVPGKRLKLVWSDEFNGNRLDAKKWNVLPEAPRKGGWWSPRAVQLDGQGNLEITTFEQAGKFYTGAVNTRGKFQQAFGYFEARMKFQRQPGFWSAFWMTCDTVGRVGDEGRDGTEIDIIEKPWRDDRVQFTLHWDGYGKAHRSAGHKIAVPGVMRGFHSVGLLWTPESYAFFVDGKELWRTKAGGVSQVPEYLIFSSEVGTWGGDIRQAQLPDRFLVDYVRVYELTDAL